MNFKKWFESLDQDDISQLNMTAKLPLADSPILNQLGELRRGFHLNTIIGRMFIGFTAPKILPRYDLAERGQGNEITNPEVAMKYSTGKPDFKPTKALHAAYDSFREAIANAIQAIPELLQRNYHTGKDIDTLTAAKSILGKYKDRYLSNNKPENIVKEMRKAWNISDEVFGPASAKEQARNFANFYSLLIDEYYESRNNSGITIQATPQSSSDSPELMLRKQAQEQPQNLSQETKPLRKEQQAFKTIMNLDAYEMQAINYNTLLPAIK
jgi:hypothetical protein